MAWYFVKHNEDLLQNYVFTILCHKYVEYGMVQNFVGNSEENKPLGRSRRRCEDNINICSKLSFFKGVD